MQMPEPLDSKIVRRMQKTFFDVDASGTLVYRDPIIGPLASAARRIRVAVNAAKQSLELHVGEIVEQRFALKDGVERACREAFAAYFETFERACQCERVAA